MSIFDASIFPEEKKGARKDRAVNAPVDIWGGWNQYDDEGEAPETFTWGTLDNTEASPAGNAYDEPVAGIIDPAAAGTYDAPRASATSGWDPSDYDPEGILGEQTLTLEQLLAKYNLASDELQKLADLMMDDTYLKKFEDIIGDYGFDSDQYRDQAQYRITQGSSDLAQQTLAKLISSGQLHSSGGQNYFAGSQAKYFTSQLSALEDTIHRYEAEAFDRQARGYQTLESMDAGQKDRYAGFIEKGLELGIDAQKVYFDGLTKLLNNEINWDMFLANYTTGTPGDDGLGSTWNDYTITGEDFSQIGTDIQSFITDSDYGWDVQVDIGGGYSVSKTAVGTDDYSVTYYKDGTALFTHTFAKTDDYGTVARSLWSKFDDGMKDNWGAHYEWDGGAGGVDPDPDPDPHPPEMEGYAKYMAQLETEHGGLADTTTFTSLGTDYTRYTYADGHIETIQTDRIGTVPTGNDDGANWPIYRSVAESVVSGLPEMLTGKDAKAGQLISSEVTGPDGVALGTVRFEQRSDGRWIGYATKAGEAERAFWPPDSTQDWSPYDPDNIVWLGAQLNRAFGFV